MVDRLPRVKSKVCDLLRNQPRAPVAAGRHQSASTREFGVDNSLTLNQEKSRLEARLITGDNSFD
jgi:hypothetical protein